MSVDPRIQAVIDGPHSLVGLRRLPARDRIVRVGKRKPTQPRGHAAPVGTGPSGETCGTCIAYTVTANCSKPYRKCGKNKANWTGGPGSDIRKKDAACSLWEAQTTNALANGR